jgi:protoporphyrinogen/coproporphyrinogen III oxidase
MTGTDVVVVGAGITGLSCAYRLQKLGLDTVILESSNRVGGVVRSDRVNDHLVEWGPSSLVPTDHTFKLISDLGLEDELIEADPKSPRYIVVGKRLRSVPLGPMSWRGLGRALAEPFIRSKSRTDETIASFFRRRFGTEAHDHLVAPFVTGIFAGDTEKLSIEAVFPRIVDIERQFGSVMVGMLRGRSRSGGGAGRRKTVSSFPSGMERLTNRLADGLNIQKNCSGIRIGKDVNARAVVLAIPAYRAAEVMEETYPDLAGILGSVDYAPVVVAATSVDEKSLTQILRGFGFLVPQEERLNILGTIFSSVLFPGRAPEGRILLTSFLGGALKPEVFDWPDERIWDVVCSELKLLLKTTLLPEPVGLFRHRRAIPQYNTGHQQRTTMLAEELRRHPGLFVTGNFLHGVSVPSCMEHGDATAAAVAEFLESK